jgi:hypothetical protein
MTKINQKTIRIVGAFSVALFLVLASVAFADSDSMQTNAPQTISAPQDYNSQSLSRYFIEQQAALKQKAVEYKYLADKYGLLAITKEFVNVPAGNNIVDLSAQSWEKYMLEQKKWEEIPQADKEKLMEDWDAYQTVNFNTVGNSYETIYVDKRGAHHVTLGRLQPQDYQGYYNQETTESGEPKLTKRTYTIMDSSQINNGMMRSTIDYSPEFWKNMMEARNNDAINN